MRILVFANTFTVLSGGDNIFVELSRRWLNAGEKVTIVTNEKGRAFCLSRNIGANNIKVWRTSGGDACGIYVSSFWKTLLSVLGSAFLKIPECDLIFSSSDFLPDVLAGLIAHRRFPKSKWFAACYYLVPPPAVGQYREVHFRQLLYYVSQRISLLLIGKFCHGLLVASEYDKNFLCHNMNFSSGRTICIRGGVDTKMIDRVPERKKKFDAVFMGRFHPQKCVEELILVWERVLRAAPGRKLALIGGGYLEKELRRLVKERKLENAVIFFGMIDGERKYEVLKEAKIFVSTSRFDSGNLSLDEALACGVPGVIYDLPRLDYPRGVVKITTGNSEAFVNSIVSLWEDHDYYDSLRGQAVTFASGLDWDITADKTLNFMKSFHRNKGRKTQILKTGQLSG